MSDNVRGQVSRTSSKNWHDDRKGVDIMLYSFQLEGGGRWFRTGTTRPQFRQGDSIAFTVDGKGNVDMSSVQQVETGSVQAPPAGAVASASSSSGGNSRNDYWENKDKFYREEEVPKISLSAARSDAVALVSAALAADAISFGNAAKGKRVDMILGYVDMVRDKFLLDTLNAKAITAELLVEGKDAPVFVQAGEEVATDSGEW